METICGNMVFKIQVCIVFIFFQGWHEREDAKRFFRLRYIFQCRQETPKSVFFCGKSNSNYEQQSQGTKEYNFFFEIEAKFHQLNRKVRTDCSFDFVFNAHKLFSYPIIGCA